MKLLVLGGHDRMKGRIKELSKRSQRYAFKIVLF